MVGASACGAGGPASLSGAHTLADALRELLAGAPCSFRVVDPRTVRISPPAPVMAQEPVRAPALVAELMVTATKRQASVGRIPAGASAIAQDQLELTGATDVGRTTGQLAGVTSTNLGPGRDKLLIRGISDGAFTGRARSTVSTYLDDAPINLNAPDPDLRLTDVGQVEVVRGPQGALYGSGALTGIYRIVTNKPDLDEVHAGVAGTATWTDDGSPSRVLEGYANVPVAAGRAAIRVAAYHDIQGGYLDNTALGENNVDRTQRDGGRLALRLQLSDAWQADLSAAGQRLRSNDSQYVGQGMGQNRRNRVQEAHKNDFGEAAFTLRGELDWASLTSSLAYVQHTYSSLYDATSQALAGGTFSNLGGDLGVFHETARASMWVEDIVLRSSRGGPLSWLVGAYATDALEKTPSTLGVRTAGTLRTAYRENRHDRVRELALYGEASWAFGGGWTAAAGGRVFETRVNTLSDVTVEAPGVSRGFEGERRFSDLTPALSLQKEFATGELLYLLYSEGFRNGGFNTGGIYPIRASRLTFRPDRLRNYEAGAKLRLLEQRLSLRSAVFYDRWSNVQSDQYRPSGVAFTGNAGDARILGLEAEAAYDFDFGLQLQANLLVSDSDMIRTDPTFSDTPLIDELPGVPEVSGGVLAVYEHPLEAGLTLRLSGEAAYVGESTVSFLRVRAYAQDDYLKARLAAEVYADRWSAMIFVNNPADSAGDTFAYGNPFIYGAEGRLVTPQRPRTLGVRLAADF